MGTWVSRRRRSNLRAGEACQPCSLEEPVASRSVEGGRDWMRRRASEGSKGVTGSRGKEVEDSGLPPRTPLGDSSPNPVLLFSVFSRGFCALRRRTKSGRRDSSFSRGTSKLRGICGALRSLSSFQPRKDWAKVGNSGRRSSSSPLALMPGWRRAREARLQRPLRWQCRRQRPAQRQRRPGRH